MKRLFIIVEGQTEEEFVKSILLPYLQNFGVYDVTPIMIATSNKGKGGFVNYEHLKNDIMRRFREPNIIITMFVDYFRIPTSIPNYEKCLNENVQIDSKIECLEQAIKQDIAVHNFIPYIQKHEFEALLFANNIGFETFYSEIISIQTQEVITNYINPEEINTGAATAPSKRLKNIIADYNKVVDGNMIALEIGIENILEKCPRFKSWVEKIILVMTENM
jgi:hypothetical protein